MKAKLYLTFSLFSLIVLGTSFTNKPGEKWNVIERRDSFQSPSDTTIYIGAFDLDNLKESYKIKDSLGFNLWHKYLTGIRDVSTGRALPKGWKVSQDSLYKMDYSFGFDSVKSIFDSNSMRGIKMLIIRPKTEWLCYGQRSDYECEKEVSNPEYNWFYTYNEHPRGQDYKDTGKFGHGVKVRLCRYGQQDSGYVVKGLKSNREQVNLTYYPGIGDNEAIWYLKPRIRIDSSFAYNNPNAKVCRVEIYNFNNIQIKSIEIRADNFYNNANPYSGQYIEKYFTSNRNYESLTIPSSFMLNPDTNYWTNTDCKVDYRVFWYAKCDMWLDYFRVDDDRANILLDSDHPENNIYTKMLQLEVDLAYQYSSSLDFYIDEFEFNHIPCIKKVSEIIRSKSNNKFSLNFLAGYDFWYWAHLPENSIPTFSVQKNHFIKYCIDSIKPKYVIRGDYPFETDRKYYPASLAPPIPQSKYLFGIPASSSTYDYWLQKYLDTTRRYGGFIRKIKEVAEISKDAGLEIISPLQAHIFVNNGSGLSEPTNEELELMLNLFLSYGSKGLLYFYYGGYDCPDEQKYYAGLAEPYQVSCGFENKYIRPRYINIYGQEKIKKVKQLSVKVKKWAPVLTTFSLEDIISCRYYDRTERKKLLENTYINEISSFSPLPSDMNIPSQISEQNTDTYLQIATMNNTEPYTTYLMIVNRRCSPYDPTRSENGGRRYLKILFDENAKAFSYFRNWKIIDVENNSTIAVFDKTNSGNINLGWFLPSEGKIFKIAPEM